jgi:hypothetical protein
VSRRKAALSLAGAVALATAGCGGGALSGKALQQEATSLQALAAEGSLLAQGAARGDTTRPFLRVHAGYLQDAARSAAAALTKGQTARAHRLTALAGRMRDELGRLSHSGSDRAVQRRLADELSSLAQRAEQLGTSG